MQPTTLCNLDCSYCYLPDKSVQRRMPPEVAAAVAESVNPLAADLGDFPVVWHGSEPLATGRQWFASLLDPFVGVTHHIQTNATLIDDAWCRLFVERGIRVSISVDGPESLSTQRRTRGDTPAYPRIVKGVAALRRHGIPFAALCVVSDPRPGLAHELYEYFRELGCTALGLNIEEREGVNDRLGQPRGESVRRFWAELVEAWRKDPSIRLRDLDWALGFAGAVLDGTADAVLPRQLDPCPAVATDGRVVLFSPELIGFTDARYGRDGDFASGNVLRTPLREIIAGAHASTNWIQQYLFAVEDCRRRCGYFGFCGGSNASNRYFEHGWFGSTETSHCRNSKIRLLDGLLDHAAGVPVDPATSPVAGVAGAVEGDPVQRIFDVAEGLRELLQIADGCRVGTPCDGYYNWNNQPQ